MRRKSGVLVICKDTGNLLLLKEAPDREYGNTWSMVAGGVEEGENAIDAAKRETKEEIGVDINEFDYYFVDREDDDNGVFNFFVAVTDEEFVPRLSDEHVDHIWVNKDELPEDLFPGMEEKINDL